MKLQIYQVLHVLSMVLLTAFVFQAFANPDPKRKKTTMIATGILSLVMLVGGFGLVAVRHVGFPWWILVKVVCWFWLAGVAGMAYRKPEKAGVLAAATAFVVALAVTLVYFNQVQFE